MFFKNKVLKKKEAVQEDIKPLDFDDNTFDNLKNINVQTTDENTKDKKVQEWQKWNMIHNEADQIKRQKSAESSKCTPLYIDEIDGIGKFQGSSGHYTTTLLSCPCIDFSRRKSPCKHMYRLAMELNLFKGNIKTNINDIPRTVPKSGIKISDAVKIIETLNKDEKTLLLYILYTMKYTNHSEYAAIQKNTPELNKLLETSIIETTTNNEVILNSYRRNELNEKLKNLNIDFKKNMKKEVLIQWIKDNIPDKVSELCKDKIAVMVSDKYLKLKHKMYLYLSRMQNSENDSYFLLQLGFSVPDTTDELPDDDITHLLKQYGHIKS